MGACPAAHTLSLSPSVSLSLHEFALGSVPIFLSTSVRLLTGYVTLHAHVLTDADDTREYMHVCTYVPRRGYMYTYTDT